MKVGQAILIRMALVLCVLLLVPTSWAATSHKHAQGKTTAKTSANSKSSVHKSSKTATKVSSKKSRRSRKSRGQQAIDSGRTREIQAALIREHYLNGEPSGSWDSTTKAALVKYQHDNGWQTKVIPDSRALIKLGLGPSREGLLNPETAAVGSPHELGMRNAIESQADAHK